MMQWEKPLDQQSGGLPSYQSSWVALAKSVSIPKPQTQAVPFIYYYLIATFENFIFTYDLQYFKDM